MSDYMFANILLWLLGLILSVRRGVWRLTRKYSPPVSPYTDLAEAEKKITAYRRGLASSSELLEYVRLPQDTEPRLIADIMIEQRLSLIRAIIGELRYRFNDTPMLESIPDTAAALLKTWQITSPSSRAIEIEGRSSWCALRTNFDWEDAVSLLHMSGAITSTDLMNFKKLRTNISNTSVTPALLEEVHLLHAWSLMNKERTQNGHSVSHP